MSNIVPTTHRISIKPISATKVVEIGRNSDVLTLFYTVKEVSNFPVPDREVTLQTKLSLAGKNLLIPGQWEFGL